MLGETRFLSDYGFDIDPYTVNHGSCVVSKVAGPQCGVAKKANIVLMDLTGTYSQYLERFSDLAVDVLRRNLQGKAVVNMSFSGRYSILSIYNLILIFV